MDVEPAHGAAGQPCPPSGSPFQIVLKAHASPACPRALPNPTGYTLEGYPGTKKPSFIEPSKKKALRAKARELALKQASK